MEDIFLEHELLQAGSEKATKPEKVVTDALTFLATQCKLKVSIPYAMLGLTLFSLTVKNRVCTSRLDPSCAEIQLCCPSLISSMDQNIGNRILIFYEACPDLCVTNGHGPQPGSEMGEWDCAVMAAKCLCIHFSNLSATPSQPSFQSANRLLNERQNLALIFQVGDAGGLQHNQHKAIQISFLAQDTSEKVCVSFLKFVTICISVMPQVLFMGWSPIVAGIVSAHNKKAMHKDLSVQGLQSYYCMKYKPQKSGHTRTKCYVLNWELISCRMFLQLVVVQQGHSCSIFSALPAICQCHSDNEGAMGSSGPRHYHSTGVLDINIQKTASSLPPQYDSSHYAAHSFIPFFAEMPRLMLQPILPSSHFCAQVSKAAQKTFLDITFFICLPQKYKKEISVGVSDKNYQTALEIKALINENGYNFSFMVH